MGSERTWQRAAKAQFLLAPLNRGSPCDAWGCHTLDPFAWHTLLRHRTCFRGYLRLRRQQHDTFPDYSGGKLFQET
jgi:hypothetical protein